MLGAIAGDIIGSVYEWHNVKTKDFPLFHEASRFTDDSVCSVAVAEALLDGLDMAGTLRAWVRRYPDAGYGGRFIGWAMADRAPAYGSWGNGSAMRVSAAGWLADGERQALGYARASAAVTHDHPDAVAGAQATALAIWLARDGAGAADIRARIASGFGYDLARSVDEIRPGYTFDVSAAGSVPEAIVCALEGRDWEDAVRNAVSIGGDSDTIACIAGGIAEALYSLPKAIAAEAESRLENDMKKVVARVPGNRL